MTIDSLHVKLASLVVHCGEFFSPGGHDYDRQAIESIVRDPEVEAFLADLPPVLLPVKRGPAGLDPLPLCPHGRPLLDGGGEILELPCGCRWPPAPREAGR